MRNIANHGGTYGQPSVMLVLERLKDLRTACTDSATAELDLASRRTVLAISSQRVALKDGGLVSLPMVSISIQALRGAVKVCRSLAETGINDGYLEQLAPFQSQLEAAQAALDGSLLQAERSDIEKFRKSGFMPRSEILVHSVISAVQDLQRAAADCRDAQGEDARPTDERAQAPAAH